MAILRSFHCARCGARSALTQAWDYGLNACEATYCSDSKCRQKGDPFSNGRRSCADGGGTTKRGERRASARRRFGESKSRRTFQSRLVSDLFPQSWSSFFFSFRPPHSFFSSTPHPLLSPPGGFEVRVWVPKNKKVRLWEYVLHDPVPRQHVDMWDEWLWDAKYAEHRRVKADDTSSLGKRKRKITLVPEPKKTRLVYCRWEQSTL